MAPSVQVPSNPIFQRMSEFIILGSFFPDLHSVAVWYFSGALKARKNSKIYSARPMLEWGDWHLQRTETFNGTCVIVFFFTYLFFNYFIFSPWVCSITSTGIIIISTSPFSCRSPIPLALSFILSTQWSTSGFALSLPCRAVRILLQ